MDENHVGAIMEELTEDSFGEITGGARVMIDPEG